MTIYRQARPEEHDDYIDLANYTFGFDMEKLLPKVYREDYDSSSITKVAEDENGRIVAQNAVLPQVVHAGNFKLRTNFLGSMVVHPRHRGEGHMKALMKACLDEMPDNFQISVLGGKRQRYEYFGYTTGGIQWEYRVIEDNIRHALKDENSEGISFLPLSEAEGWMDLVIRLYTDRDVYVERDPKQMQYILASYHQHALGILKDGNLIGYLLVSKDKTSVSEFEVLDSSDTKKIVKAYFSTFGLKNVQFTFPPYERDVTKEFSDFAEWYTIQPNNMFNIFDFAAVLEAFLTVKHRTYVLSDGCFSAVMDGQPVTITVTQNEVDIKREAKDDAIILDKMDAQKLILTPYGRYMNLPVPLDWFPLPLFWHTVDCF